MIPLNALLSSQVIPVNAPPAPRRLRGVIACSSSPKTIRRLRGVKTALGVGVDGLACLWVMVGFKYCLHSSIPEGAKGGVVGNRVRRRLEEDLGGGRTSSERLGLGGGGQS